MTYQKSIGNNYIPRVVSIQRIIKETQDTNTFHLKCSLDFLPGQFLEVSCLGLGECPVSISSSPGEEFTMLTFKRVGCVTTGLSNLQVNDSVGIRGPFGNGFPLSHLEAKNLIFVAGGIGIAPLRSLFKFIISKKKRQANKIAFLYGARRPKDLLYKGELDDWAKFIEVKLIVDMPDTKWKGNIGVVPQLLNEIRIEPAKTKAFLCGPGMMLRFTTAKLIELGVPASDILLSLERHMKCGVGKCGHCYIGDKFVCRDGPVFTLAQLNNLIPTEIL